MDKSLINKRFLEAINLLVSNKIAKNKAEISHNLGISASKFSEILNERMLAGVDLLAKISEIYNISPDWLLSGKGEMLKKQGNNAQNQSIIGDNNVQAGNNSKVDARHYYSDSPDVLRAQIEEKDRLLNEKDERLREKDERLREKDEYISELRETIRELKAK
jgi:transcriptional regulator with XRE-family HTH domain